MGSKCLLARASLSNLPPPHFATDRLLSALCHAWISTCAVLLLLRSHLLWGIDDTSVVAKLQGTQHCSSHSQHQASCHLREGEKGERLGVGPRLCPTQAPPARSSPSRGKPLPLLKPSYPQDQAPPHPPSAPCPICPRLQDPRSPWGAAKYEVAQKPQEPLVLHTL